MGLRTMPVRTAPTGAPISGPPRAPGAGTAAPPIPVVRASVVAISSLTLPIPSVPRGTVVPAAPPVPVAPLPPPVMRTPSPVVRTLIPPAARIRGRGGARDGNKR